MSNAKQYDDTNTGIVGANDYKQKDTHPDIRGRVNVEGIWYWMSGWKKQSGGREFHSLALTQMTQAEVDTMMEKRAAKNAPQQRARQQQPQQQQQQRPQQQAAPAGHPANEPPMDFDDDIPF